jgi:hypothetical protein
VPAYPGLAPRGYRSIVPAALAPHEWLLMPSVLLFLGRFRWLAGLGHIRWRLRSSCRLALRCLLLRLLFLCHFRIPST